MFLLAGGVHVGAGGGDQEVERPGACVTDPLVVNRTRRGCAVCEAHRTPRPRC